MNKKLLKQLIEESYTENELNTEKVQKIADLLKRKDLKIYINALRDRENQMRVIVSTPQNIEMDEEVFQKLFPNKKILFEQDLDLLLGIKITDNDMVYNFTLKNRLDKIIEKLKESYD